MQGLTAMLPRQDPGVKKYYKNQMIRPLLLQRVPCRLAA